MERWSVEDVGLCNIAKVCALCNDAAVEFDEQKMRFKAVGEPTEAALQVLVEKLGLPANADVVEEGERNEGKDMRAVNTMKQDPSMRCQIATRYWRDRYDVLATLEFTRSRKSMSVICAPKVPESPLFHSQNVSGHNLLLVKGAPENILARCSSLCTEVRLLSTSQSFHRTERSFP